MSLRGATPGSEDVPWIKLDKFDDRRVLFPPPIIIMEFYVLRSFSTVYATVVKSDSNLVVNTNRGDQAASKLSSEVMIPNHGIEIINKIPFHASGVTLVGSLRRRPNAFNLLHQLEFLERSGMTQEMSVKSLEAGCYHMFLLYPSLPTCVEFV